MNLKDYFKKAQKEKWAIGQFNVANLETLRAVVQAAKSLKSPLIVGTSEGESKFIGMTQIAGLVKSWRKTTGLPIFLHLDHGKSFGYIKEAVAAGYDSVHFDGSALSFPRNIQEAKKVKNYAKRFGVLVEGEIDAIGENLTEPAKAREFIEATGVDSLAVNIGTHHGIGRKRGINFQRLAEIKRKLKSTPLVLHGGSGVPAAHVKKAIKAGIVKININTELRLAYTGTLERALQGEEIVPYKYLPQVIEAVQKVVEGKIKLFGSKNKI